MQEAFQNRVVALQALCRQISHRPSLAVSFELTFLKLGFMLGNHLHFIRTGRAFVEAICQPLLGQPSRQLQAHDPLPHAQDLRIVTRDRLLDRKAIVRRHGPDAAHFVRADRNPKTGPADEKRPVCFTGENMAAGSDGNVRVRRFILGGEDPDVDDFGNERVRFEVGF